MNVTQLKKRITSGKFQGDDHYSWAVFIDRIPFMTGLGRDEVPYYKRQALDRLLKEVPRGN